MSQEQVGVIECFYVYVPGVKTAMFNVVNDKKSIQEIMEVVANKLKIDLKNKFIMAGGVILNTSLSFKFYKDQIKEAKRIISIVSIPSARKVPKLPKAIQFICPEKAIFEFPKDDNVKPDEKAKLEAKEERDRFYANAEIPISRKLNGLLQELTELKDKYLE